MIVNAFYRLVNNHGNQIQGLTLRASMSQVPRSSLEWIWVKYMAPPELIVHNKHPNEIVSTDQEGQTSSPPESLLVFQLALPLFSL